MTALPDRIAWAIEQLDPSPGDLVLEIGCGRGIAAAAICDRLKRGSYVGLDRSKTAIDAARKRCADQIAAGKARFVLAPLAATVFGKERFDCVLAINVNAFWVNGEAEVAAVRAALRPKGQLLLAYEPPSPSSETTTLTKLRMGLTAGGFTRVRNVSATRGSKLQMGVFASA